MVGRPYSEDIRDWRFWRNWRGELAARRGASLQGGASSAIRWKKRLDETGSAARGAAGGQEPLASGGARALAVGADRRGA